MGLVECADERGPAIPGLFRVAADQCSGGHRMQAGAFACLVLGVVGVVHLLVGDRHRLWHTAATHHHSGQFRVRYGPHHLLARPLQEHAQLLLPVQIAAQRLQRPRHLVQVCEGILCGTVLLVGHDPPSAVRPAGSRPQEFDRRPVSA